MILTHPYIFNTIVVLFIAFTSGWMVFVFISRRINKLNARVRELEKQKEQLKKQLPAPEEQFEKNLIYPLNSTPVITLSSVAKANKSN